MQVLFKSRCQKWDWSQWGIAVHVTSKSREGMERITWMGRKWPLQKVNPAWTARWLSSECAVFSTYEVSLITSTNMDHYEMSDVRGDASSTLLHINKEVMPYNGIERRNRFNSSCLFLEINHLSHLSWPLQVLPLWSSSTFENDENIINNIFGGEGGSTVQYQFYFCTLIHNFNFTELAYVFSCVLFSFVLWVISACVQEDVIFLAENVCNWLVKVYPLNVNARWINSYRAFMGQVSGVT